MHSILIADDDASIRTVLAQALSRAGYDVRAASNAANLMRWVNNGEGDLVITDVVMPDEQAFDFVPRIRQSRPDLPILIMSAQNTFQTAIRASEVGAYDYLPKPFDLREIVALVGRALAEPKTNSREKKEEAQQEGLPLVGRSGAMQEVYRTLARLMQTDLTVLITGESGTGKEVVARSLHEFGRRKRGSFVAVNMAAIPRDLIESELFGHEKGAFTGAVARQAGHFEQAEGGTLFLDEIGDMPMEAQTRLLRVLQQGEYMSVGGRVPIKTDVRIVAATNKDLRVLISQGLFREDLYYRLNVVPLRLPPLRERKEDIVDLVRHFLGVCEREGMSRKHFEPKALEKLKDYKWPGNVRELENFVRRLVALSPYDTLSAANVDAQLQDFSQNPLSDLLPDQLGQDMTLKDLCALYMQKHLLASGAATPKPGVYHRMLRDFEAPLISAVLMLCKGNQLKASDMLGLNRNTLRKKIQDLNLSVMKDW